MRRLITDVTNFPDADPYPSGRLNPFPPPIPEAPQFREKKPKQISADVFISYATADGTQAAKQLREDLEESGFSVWQDVKSFRGGENWRDQLREAIRHTKAVLVMLTPGAVESKYVTWECEVARATEKKIIPVLIHTCNVPEEIKPLQHRDLSNEQKYMKGLLAIIKDINRLKG